MKKILVVGEDALSCALGERLVATALPDWQLSAEPVNKNGITKLVASFGRYAQLAHHVLPVLCVADTDGRCAVELMNAWIGPAYTDRLIVRLAVSEAESWVIADRTGFAHDLGVPLNKLPHSPDIEADPKRLVLTLLRRSTKRILRDEAVSGIDPTKPGSGYNFHLCKFVRNNWDAQRGAACSPSLARALMRLRRLELPR